MSDSRRFERLAEKHEENRRERFAAIARWIEYVEDNPPEVWGPQQNAVVNAQIESARAAALPVDHELRVRAFAAAVEADRNDATGDRTLQRGLPSTSSDEDEQDCDAAGEETGR